MGYQTHFELTVKDDDGHKMTKCPTCGVYNDIDHEELITQFLEGYNPFEESCKWYEWESDMIEYSKQWPNTTFIIDGEGEESGDIWRAWFKGGKTYTEVAKIQIAPFDPDKLV